MNFHFAHQSSNPTGLCDVSRREAGPRVHERPLFPVEEYGVPWCMPGGSESRQRGACRMPIQLLRAGEMR
jgi:hypothetical protein